MVISRLQFALEHLEGGGHFNFNRFQDIVEPALETGVKGETGRG